MTVGEFSRKLKEAVNAEGYTCNNVELLDIIDITPTDNATEDLVFKVKCYSSKDREFIEFIIETDKI